jgi:hypothetical protein
MRSIVSETSSFGNIKNYLGRGTARRAMPLLLQLIEKVFDGEHALRDVAIL